MASAAAEPAATSTEAAGPRSAASPSSDPGRPNLEVDEQDDNDSTFGDGSSSASTSLASSVLKYEWRHGRRYHAYQSGNYSFPNDDAEQDRLDMVHHLYYRLLDDRLFLAPVQPEGLDILDIGTGTGAWAIDLGDQYPGANIVGNDLSAIQPDWVPPNVKFLIDDVELPWAEPIQYDYIHCRYMAGSIKDWPGLVKQIYANLKPGGWVEFQESANTLYSEDESLKPDNPMVRMMDLLKEGCDRIGRTMDPAPSFVGWVEDAGFARVEEQKFRLPVGTWPKDPRMKEVGTMLAHNFHEGVSSFTAVLFRDVLGWQSAEVELFNASVRKAVRQPGVHPMFDFLVVTAQKPLKPE